MSKLARPPRPRRHGDEIDPLASTSSGGVGSGGLFVSGPGRSRTDFQGVMSLDEMTVKNSPNAYISKGDVARQVLCVQPHLLRGNAWIRELFTSFCEIL